MLDKANQVERAVILIGVTAVMFVVGTLIAVVPGLRTVLFNFV